jgi:hypothetical protein
MRRFALLVVALATLAPACGGVDDDPPTGPEFCREFSALLCKRTYECTTEEERAGSSLPPTEAECATQAQMSCAAGAETNDGCDPGETYHPDTAQACLVEVARETCTDYTRNRDTASPSCEEICTETPAG